MASRLRFLLVWLVMGSEACAHTMGKQLGDFYDGMLHPVLSLEHLLLLIALGLLAGQHGSTLSRSLLAGMAAGAAVGGILASWLSSPPEYALGVISLMVMAMTGGAVAGAWRLPRRLLPCVGIISAMAISLLTMAGRPDESRPIVYCTGLFLALMLVVLLISGMAARMSHDAGWKAIAVRVMGSWILAIALMMLALQGR